MSKNKSNLKSTCCGAKVRIEGINDFDKQCTMYHVCTNCNKPCDVIIPKRKIWAINPKTRIVPNKKKKDWDKLTKKEINDFKMNEDF